MCLIALLFRVVEDAPLVVGANREEDYARGGTPPQLLDGPVPAVAGIDPAAGGTWLGVNAYGVLAAVTNRRKTTLPDLPRSRGLLVRELLACSSAQQAAAYAARELGNNTYAGCNLIVADARDAVVIQAGDLLRVRPLPPGIHVIANRDVDDPTDVRATYSLRWLASQPLACSAQCVMALEDLCVQTGTNGPPICLRGPTRGTTSSSILVVRSRPAQGSYWHAQGPPDVTPYSDCTHLVRALSRER